MQRSKLRKWILMFYARKRQITRAIWAVVIAACVIAVPVVLLLVFNDDKNDKPVVPPVANAHKHTLVVDAAIAPTCTETGLTEGEHCSGCGMVTIKQTIVETLAHTEIINEAKEATCTTVGWTEWKQCAVCHQVLVEWTEIAALGHTEVVDAAVEPVCNEPGKTEGVHCSVCNEILVKQSTIPHLGHQVDLYVARNGSTHYGMCSICEKEVDKNHSYVDKRCTDCGYRLFMVGGYLDRVDYFYNGSIVGNAFAEGNCMKWDTVANVSENIDTISLFGWVGFTTETPGIYGYSIDGGEVYYNAKFSQAADQAVLQDCKGKGGTSASRYTIRIPVGDLSGSHIIEIWTKDNDDIAVLVFMFTLEKSGVSEKPIVPNVPEVEAIPSFWCDATSMYNAAISPMTVTMNQEIASATLSEDESYVSLLGSGEDMYFAIIPNGSSRQVSRYVVIKYRTTETEYGGELFVGSGGAWTGTGDIAPLEYIADGEWHLMIVDLDEVEAVWDAYQLGYMRLDCYTDGTDRMIDLAYVASFDSIEDAEAYDVSWSNEYLS